MVEVMIAILLSSIAVIGVVGLFKVETRASGFSRHTTEAAVLAQDKLEQLRTQIAPTAASTATETTLNDRGISAPLEVPPGRYTRVSTVAVSNDVFDIVVTVSWDEDGEARSVIVRGQRGTK